MTDLDSAFSSLIKLAPGEYQAELGIIVGSGLGGLVDLFTIVKTIDYTQLNGFPKSTAPSHKGCLHLARHEGKNIVIFDGRLHMYEGWSAQQSVMPVRLAKMMGVQNLIISNAVGALNPEFNPGDVMLVTDHLNFTGRSPLRGQNDESLGERFPDMSQAYNSGLQTLAESAFDDQSIPLRRGIYTGVFGPELETSAERRFLRLAGGDAVGMSLIMETIAAVHCGINVLALAAISNNATGGPEQQPDSIEAVLKNAAVAGEKMARTLPSIVEHL